MNSRQFLGIFAWILAGCGTGSSDLSFRGETGASQEPLRNIAVVTVQGENDSTPDRSLSASETSVFLWSAVEGAVRYELTIFENDETTVKCAARTVGSVSLTFTGCPLEDRRTYQLRIRAFDVNDQEIRLAISFFSFNVRKLQWTPMNSSLFAGETLQLGVNYGSLPYSIVDGGSGFLSIPGLLYAPPTGSAPRSESLIVQDADGNIHLTTVRTIGFADRGDLGLHGVRQVLSVAGSLYAAGWSVVSGDEGFVTLRSNDQGATWTSMESHFTLSENQRAEGLGVDGNGDLYVAGWGRFDGNAPALVVRKSLDGGTSWSTVDSFAVPGGGPHELKAFVSKADGRSFYLLQTEVSGVPVRRLRGSNASGVTWSTLADFPIDGAAQNVEFQSLLTDASGALWIGLSEEIGGQVGLSIYRSVDHGVTWVRRLRLDAESQMGVIREVGGQVSIVGPFGVFQSSNTGLSWSHRALPLGWSDAKDLIQSSSGRLFISDGRHVAVSSLDGNSWAQVDDIQLTARTSPTLGAFVPCDTQGVCVVHTHDPAGGRVMPLRVLR